MAGRQENSLFPFTAPFWTPAARIKARRTIFEVNPSVHRKRRDIRGSAGATLHVKVEGVLVSPLPHQILFIAATFWSRAIYRGIWFICLMKFSVTTGAKAPETRVSGRGNFFRRSQATTISWYSMALPS